MSAPEKVITDGIKSRSKHFMSENGNGKLRLYNAFPRNYKSMKEATTDLERIGQLGFNSIWINPINDNVATSTVKRLNLETLESQDVKSSLYAGSNFDRLNHNLFPDLASPEDTHRSGDPAESSKVERDMLSAYTTTARKNGMQPIFDLVLNHVGIDSPLVKGECPYFVKKGINTTRWFKGKDSSWDDVSLFDYSDEAIRNEIIREFWFPLTKKYIDDFGFGGIRVDFAGGREGTKEVEKAVCGYIRELMATKDELPIIFAELLPPGDKLDKNIRELRELYTHVTNSTLWNVDAEEIGKKRQSTHLTLDSNPIPLPGGTVGFASSHDHGPNVRNTFQEIVNQIIQGNEVYKALFSKPKKSQDEKEECKKILEGIITHKVEELVDGEKMAACLLEQRKRLAICALVSDGGFYLLSGDEFSKKRPASIFEDPTGNPVYDDARNFDEAKEQKSLHHTKLIQQLNATVADQPRSTLFHWAQVIDLPAPYTNVVAVINYNGQGYEDPNPILSIVNLQDDTTVELTDDLIQQIAVANSQQKNTHESYIQVFNCSIQLIGEFNTTKYDKNKLRSFNQSDLSEATISKDASTWEISSSHGKIQSIRSRLEDIPANLGNSPDSGVSSPIDQFIQTKAEIQAIKRSTAEPPVKDDEGNGPPGLS